MQLAIDFGTSSTVILFGEPPRPLIVESAVAVTAEGAMLTGPDVAASPPENTERHPKLRAGDGVIRAGGRELPVGYTIGAVLHRAATEVTAAVGAGDRQVTLTHPAAWGPAQLAMLTEAATWAQFATVRLVPEPIAAAATHPVPPGHALAVYHLGAGTFDIAVVRDGALIATAGLPDVSGLHLDAIVVGLARRLTVATAPDVWARLEQPRTTDDRRAQAQLWQTARTVREQLSSLPSAWFQVPMLATPVPLDRAQFEAEAAPLLERTVALTLQTMQQAGGPVTAVLLAGGVTRTPLVAALLHRALGVAPALADDPELVVARGALAGSHPPPLARPAVVPTPGYPRVEPVEIAINGAAGITLRWIDRELDEDGSGGTHEEPRFLVANGRVQVFGTADGLVAYLHSDAVHALRDRPGWPEYLRWVTPPALFPAPDHRYELDLVAENLAGGRDAWIPELVLGAGVVARDLAYALDLEVWTLLARDSLLDELDEALRRQNRWKLRGLDPALVAAHWQQVVDELEDVIEHRP